MKNFDLMRATETDAKIIQHMWPFYIYDLTRYCGNKPGWENPTALSFKSDDVGKYFKEKNCNIFIIKISNENIGFTIIKKLEVMPEVDWYVSEFYISSKYQRSGIGQEVAKDIFNMFQGEWSVGVLPENIAALKFWRKVISNYSAGKYHEVLKSKDELKTPEYPDPYAMIMLRFKTD